MKNVYAVLYEDFTAFDVFGPVEVLSSIKEYMLHYVSMNGGIVANRQSIRLETESMQIISEGGILLVPGGFGSRQAINDSRFIDELSRAMNLSEYVLCVCTGSALAAKTGLLDGKNATSNIRAFDCVRSTRPQVNWQRNARWIVDGKFYTSAGVSAGIDMALGFVRDVFGVGKADEICTRMEYNEYDWKN